MSLSVKICSLQIFISTILLMVQFFMECRTPLYCGTLINALFRSSDCTPPPQFYNATLASPPGVLIYCVRSVFPLATVKLNVRSIYLIVVLMDYYQSITYSTTKNTTLLCIWCLCVSSSHEVNPVDFIFKSRTEKLEISCQRSTAL